MEAAGSAGRVVRVTGFATSRPSCFATSRPSWGRKARAPRPSRGLRSVTGLDQLHPCVAQGERMCVITTRMLSALLIQFSIENDSSKCTRFAVVICH